MKTINKANHLKQIDERTVLLYPNYNDFDAGQEPAIIVKGFNGTLEITQGDESIIIPDAARKDLGVLINSVFIK